ncbi:MAG: hypothetical protein ACI4U5_04465 [Bacilli bacterium]
MNLVSITGSLQSISSSDSNIRYIKYVRSYKDKKGIFQEDIFPCMYWTRDCNNELFSLQDNSYVAISGRIEKVNELVVIIIEQLEYLGVKR